MEQNLYGQMETENNVKKETTTSIEHSDFEDIFTGYGNTDSVQKIVSDYNSDEDVESETDYHNIAMKTTCFDIHEQQLEIIRQYASGMIFSQNLLSDVPERHVVSGFLSVHNFICDSIKNTELNDKAEIFKHGIPQFREVRSKQLFHESEDNKYTSDCCHGQHKIVETDKRQHARTYVVKDCCRRAPRNTRQENNISPNCPYMNGQEIGNVPIHEEDRLQPRHHIEQTLVPSTAPVNQARVAAEAEAVRIPGLNSIEISGSAGQGRLLGTSQSGDFSFRFPSTQSGLNSIEISGSAGQGRLLGTSQSGDFSFRFPSTQSGLNSIEISGSAGQGRLLGTSQSGDFSFRFPSTQSGLNSIEISGSAGQGRLLGTSQSGDFSFRFPSTQSGLNSIEISGSAGQGRLLGTSQSGDFSFRFRSTQSGLNSIEISGSAGQGRLLGTSQSGDFSFRFPSTQSGLNSIEISGSAGQGRLLGTSQSGDFSFRFPSTQSGLNSIEISGSAGQGRLLGTSQSGDFSFRFPSTQSGSKGPTPPQRPNRKSPTLDQGTHVPSGSPEKQSLSQPRPDLRASTPPQQLNRKSPTLDQGTHVSSDSPEKQSLSQPRPDLRGPTPPQQPNRKSPTLDQGTHGISGSPEKQSLSQPRPDLRPPARPKSTSSCSRGNSLGQSGFYIGGFIICLLVLPLCCATSQPNGTKVDLQSDSLVHVFGESLNLICSINNSIANKTYAWNRQVGELKAELIYFRSILINTTKFEIIGDGSTLLIKNLNEVDIRDYFYYCSIGVIYSACKNILDQNNTVVIPSRTAVTFPMNKTIRLQSGCYPNLTFFLIIQGSVVANKTATKKDNGLYEVDMIYNGTLKNGEQLLVIARHGNKNFTVYNSTVVQIIKHEDSSGINIGLIVGILVVAVISIVLVVYIIYKRRRLRRDANGINVPQAGETGAQNGANQVLLETAV